MTSKQVNQMISQVYSDLNKVVKIAMTKAADDTLIKTEHGIVIFNKYLLVTLDEGVDLYLRSGQQDKIHFNTAKTALIWAILDHNIKITDAKRVRELDVLITSSKIDAEIHKNYKKKKNIDDYLIFYSKYQHALDKQKQFLAELDKYTIQAQRCQTKGTKNEIK